MIYIFPVGECQMDLCIDFCPEEIRRNFSIRNQCDFLIVFHHNKLLFIVLAKDTAAYQDCHDIVFVIIGIKIYAI